jgi:uncharacterized protein with GYD domain
MPTYLVLYRFTDQGRKNIKASVKRAEQVRREQEAHGFKILGRYWTQGRYDLVSIVEAPSEEAMMAAMFNIAAAGNVVSETVRAFTDTELLAIGAVDV